MSKSGVLITIRKEVVIVSSSMTDIKLDEERIINEFLTWAKINAPSQSEKNIANVLVSELEKLGFSIEFDDAHKNFNGNCGNLVAYWEGNDQTIPPLFLSTHMDTVMPTEGLKPVIKDGVIASDGTTILGADDRSAITAYLEAIRYIQKFNLPCGPIELILTVNEQRGLQGAKYLDYSKVKSKYGYVFDASGDVGQIITQGTHNHIFHIDVHGKSAHLSGNPEGGISAFHIAAHIIGQTQYGRIKENLVSNFGLIEGGELTSIIPRHVKLTGEARSLSKSELDSHIESLLTTASKIASDHGGTVETKVEVKYPGFNVDSDNPLVENAVEATKVIELKPRLDKTLGEADTMYFNKNGLTCITLGNGFKDVHTFNENISIENLVNMVRYSISLILSWYNKHKS